jgi:hypothetical protein
MRGQYWRRVRSKAWGDTLHALALDSRPRVVAQILIAAFAIGLIFYFGEAGDIKSKSLTAITTAAAYAAVFVLTLLTNLLLIAPAKINNEAEAKIRSLEDELQQNLNRQSTKEERQAVIDDLAEEINWATQNLLNQRPHPLKSPDPTNRPAIEDWRLNCETWFQKVSDKLANRRFFTRAQQLHFDVLANVDQVMTQGSSRFVKMYNIVSTKIRRLRDLIEQLSRV